MADVFVSYARADMARVKPLVRLIERQGWSVFWDTNLVPGDQWRHHLLQELQSCAACVVVWSLNSVRSEWVVEESALAQARKILVPVMIDPIDIPLGFRSVQAANLSGWQPDDSSHDQAELIIARLRLLIERTEPAVPISTTLSRAGYDFDLRALQAASDQVGSRELMDRYDFSKPNSSDPSRAVGLDAGGAVWIDFAADMGGKTEPGFTLAHLMASDSLDVAPAGRLEHGSIFITTDGLAPANVSGFDYEIALRQKLETGALAQSAPRKLFAIPGPYENPFGRHFTGHLRRVIREFLLIPNQGSALAGFDALFCGARQGLGARIGPWECPQHRSYWALRLPHDWLLFGLDLPNGSIDDAQLNYFERIADRTSREDSIIICLSEAPWLERRPTEVAARTFAKVTSVAQKNGAKVGALLAGGAHFYSRYQSKQGIQFITSGGATGGLHPTHFLERKPTVAFDARQQPGAKPKREQIKLTRKAAWPSRWRSRLISLRRLTYPFSNYRFAVAMGIVYWVMIWLFASTPFEGSDPQRYRTVGDVLNLDPSFHWFPDLILLVPLAAAANTLFSASLVLLWLTLYYYVDQRLGRAARVSLATLHWFCHVTAMIGLYFVMSVSTVWIIEWLWPQLSAGLQSIELKTNNEVRELFRAIVLFPLFVIFIGGIAPGLVWGMYLFLSGLLLRAHRLEAFESLDILDYKTFLRIRLSRDEATIYPIGIKSVLSPRELRRSETAAPGNAAAAVPAHRLRPILIEEPVVIRKALPVAEGHVCSGP